MAILSVEGAVRYLLHLHYDDSVVRDIESFRAQYGDKFAEEVRRQVLSKRKISKLIDDNAN